VLFLNVCVSQDSDSEATGLRHGENFYTCFIENFLLFRAVKALWKSVDIWQSYCEKQSATFLWDIVYTNTTIVKYHSMTRSVSMITLILRRSTLSSLSSSLLVLSTTDFVIKKYIKCNEKFPTKFILENWNHQCIWNIYISSTCFSQAISNFHSILSRTQRLELFYSCCNNKFDIKKRTRNGSSLRRYRWSDSVDSETVSLLRTKYYNDLQKASYVSLCSVRSLAVKLYIWFTYTNRKMNCLAKQNCVWNKILIMTHHIALWCWHVNVMFNSNFSESENIYVLTVRTSSSCCAVDSSLSVLRRMANEASWRLGNGFPTSHVIVSSSFNAHDCYNAWRSLRVMIWSEEHLKSTMDIDISSLLYFAANIITYKLIKFML